MNVETVALTIRKRTEVLVADLMASEGTGRFDTLIAVRDAAIALVNDEREAEKKRVAAARDRLKTQLKEQQDRLRSVSVVTKPRGKRESKAAPALQSS